MATWTNKQRGALIGALIVFLVITIGAGVSALVVIGGIVGYFVGKFLDGELDLENVRARAQGRTRRSDAPAQESPYAPPPVAPEAGARSRTTLPRVQ